MIRTIIFLYDVLSHFDSAAAAVFFSFAFSSAVPHEQRSREIYTDVAIETVGNAQATKK